MEDSVGRLAEQVQDGWNAPKNTSEGTCAQRYVLLAFEFTRAYDTVDHRLLRVRLIELGIPRCFYAWIWQFLRDRRARVEYHGARRTARQATWTSSSYPSMSRQPAGHRRRRPVGSGGHPPAPCRTLDLLQPVAPESSWRPLGWRGASSATTATAEPHSAPSVSRRLTPPACPTVLPGSDGHPTRSAGDHLPEHG